MPCAMRSDPFFIQAIDVYLSTRRTTNDNCFHLTSTHNAGRSEHLQPKIACLAGCEEYRRIHQLLFRALRHEADEVATWLCEVRRRLPCSKPRAARKGPLLSKRAKPYGNPRAVSRRGGNDQSTPQCGGIQNRRRDGQHLLQRVARQGLGAGSKWLPLGGIRVQ